MQSEEETRKILKDANELYSQKKYGTAINLLKGLTMEKIPTNLIPYVLELQIRNYMSLLQFKTALKILKESLKFMPNLRDFLLKKVECEFVLNDKDAIKQSIEKLRNNLKENSKGLSPDQALEHSKIGESLNQMERLINEQKERDLTKIRVCFKGSGFVNKTVKLDNNLLSKGVIFSQNDQSLEVVFSKHKIENLNDVKVNFHIKNVIISYPAKGESEGVFFLDLDLYAEICPEKSKFELNQEGKLMAILVKKTEGEYWESLCSFVAEVETQDDTGLTNTAKNWDKICKEESHSIYEY